LEKALFPRNDPPFVITIVKIDKQGKRILKLVIICQAYSPFLLDGYTLCKYYSYLVLL
jgi:hypothetical protein